MSSPAAVDASEYALGLAWSYLLLRQPELAHLPRPVAASPCPKHRSLARFLSSWAVFYASLANVSYTFAGVVCHEETTELWRNER
jgi:hypothetical protein